MTTETRDRTRHETRAAMVSLVIAIALLAIKFTAYLLTDSSAIFSDAAESIVNVLASALSARNLLFAGGGSGGIGIGERRGLSVWGERGAVEG